MRDRSVAAAPRSQDVCTVGGSILLGEGVQQSYQEAVTLFRQSAMQGNPDAQYNLAVAYAFGEGVNQDFNEAVTWYAQAAEQGNGLGVQSHRHSPGPHRHTEPAV